MIFFTTIPSSLGVLLAARTEQGFCALLLGDDASALQLDLFRRFPVTTLQRRDDLFSGYEHRLIQLVDEPRQPNELPLDMKGTDFQLKVWMALKRIPAGETRSYSEVAKSINAPSSVRAIASACSANALAIAIPCHRVVRSNGELSGYRWGSERKTILLQREGARSI